VIIELPWPPSVNSCYRAINGRNILSKAGRNYKKENVKRMSGQPLIRFAESDRLSLMVDLHAPSRHRYDLDNRLKILCDLLEEIGVIPNDNQIDELQVSRKEIFPGGKAVCKISVIKVVKGADAPQVQKLAIKNPLETTRQKISQMLDDGMRQIDIAKELEVTPACVSQHVRSIRNG